MAKEFKQLSEGALPGKPVIAPVDPTILTKEDIKRALEAVNLIKEKQCGKTKAECVPMEASSGSTLKKTSPLHHRLCQ